MTRSIRTFTVAVVFFALVSGFFTWIQAPLGPYSISPDTWFLLSISVRTENPEQFRENLAISSQNLDKLYPKPIMFLLNLAKGITGDYERAVLFLQFIFLWLGPLGFFLLFLHLTDDWPVSLTAALLVGLSHNSTTVGDVWGFFPAATVLERTIFLALFAYVFLFALRGEGRLAPSVAASALLAFMTYVHPLYAPPVGAGTWLMMLYLHRRCGPEASTGKFILATTGAALLIGGTHLATRLGAVAPSGEGESLLREESYRLLRTMIDGSLFRLGGGLGYISSDMLERNPGLIALAMSLMAGVGYLALRHGGAAGSGEGARRQAGFALAAAALYLPGAAYLLSRDSYDPPSGPFIQWHWAIGDVYINAGVLAVLLLAAAAAAIPLLSRIRGAAPRRALASLGFLAALGLPAVIAYRDVPLATALFAATQKTGVFVFSHSPWIALGGILLFSMLPGAPARTRGIVLAGGAIFASLLLLTAANLYWLKLPILLIQVRAYMYVYILLPIAALSLFPPLLGALGRGPDPGKPRTVLRVAYLLFLLLAFAFPLRSGMARAGLWAYEPPRARGLQEVSVREVDRDASEAAAFLRERTKENNYLLGPLWLEYKALRTVRFSPGKVEALVFFNDPKIPELIEIKKSIPAYYAGCSIGPNLDEKLGVRYVVTPTLLQFGNKFYLPKERGTQLRECTVFENRSFRIHTMTAQ